MCLSVCHTSVVPLETRGGVRSLKLELQAVVNYWLRCWEEEEAPPTTKPSLSPKDLYVPIFLLITYLV